MTTPLKFAMLITADGSGAKTEVKAVRSEVGGLTGAAKSAGGGLDAMSASLARNTAAARQASDAMRGAAGAERDYKAIIERSVGINRSPANSNRAREVAEYGKALDELRARYNPLFAAGQSYKTQLGEIRQAERIGAISTAEAAAAITRAKAAFAGQVTAMRATAGAARLTSQQMLNLSRQGNDVVTMWLMGASAQQIFVSQTGQVIGALEEGPGGLRGSLKAVGAGLFALATPMNLAIVGLTAAAGAGIYFATRTADKIKPLTEAMADHKDAVDAVAKSYGLVMEKAEAAQGGSAGFLTFRERRTRAELELSARASLSENFKPGLTETDIFRTRVPGPGPEDIARVTDEYKPFEAALLRVNKQMRDGRPDAASFVEEVAKIANLDPANDELQTLAQRLIAIAAPAADAQRQMRSMALSIDRVTAASQKAYRESRDTLRDRVPDLTSDREQVERLYQQQVNAAGRLGASPNAIQGIVIAADRDRAAALAEIEREESVIRQGRDLDLRAVTARTVAERALIAAERERLELSGTNVAESEKAARIAAASTRVFAEAVMTANDALRRSETARAAAGLEGYRAALAGINAQYGEQIRLADGSAEAIARLGQARALDIEALQIETRRSLYQPLEERLAKAKAEAAVIGLGDDARRRAMVSLEAETAIRRAGINAVGEMAQSYRAEIAAIADYEDSVRRVGEAWSDARRVGEDAIDGLTGALSTGDFEGALKSISEDFVKTALQLSVANPLKNRLLGSSAGTIADLFNGAPAAPSLAIPPIQNLASATITAGVVNLSGGLTGGLGGGAGASGGAGAAIERLLTPANSNRPSGGPVATQIAEFFAAKGLKPHQIAGILGNISAESAFNPLAVGDGGNAYGLAQHNDRSAALFDFIGGRKNLGDVEGQLKFIWKELQTSERSSLDRLLASRDVRGATEAFVGFERPSGYSVGNPGGSHNFSGRLAAANDAFAKLNETSGELASSATAFTQDFGQVTGAVNAGIGQIADRFVPGFGGVLQTLLDGMSQKGGGGAGGLLGSLLGGLGGGTVSSGATAAILSSGSAGLFARGGIADRPSIFGDGQLKEAAVPLPDGRSIPVTMRMAPGAGASGTASAPPVSITVNTINNSSASVTTRERDDGKGGRIVENVIDDQVAGSLSRPNSASFAALEAQAGLRKQVFR